MASIPLNVLVPDSNEPLRMAQGLQGIQAQQQAIALRNALAPGQLQQQQQALQTGNLQNERLQLENAQTKALNSAYHDALEPDEQGNLQINYGKLQRSLASNNAGAAIPETLKGLTAWQQASENLQKTQNDLQIQSKDALGLLGSTLQKANYDPNLADLLIQQRLGSKGIAPQEVQQLQGIRQQIQNNPGIVKQLADSWVGQSPEQAKLNNAIDVAKLRSNTPEKQELTDWLAANPGKTAADYPAAKAAAVAQQELPIRVNQATQEANARLGVENSAAAIQGAADKATAVQNALTKGSNAALAGVAPHLVAPASAAANKAGEDYAQAKSVTDRLSAMMDAAKNGNVVSYQLIPQEGALQVTTSQGVHRINMAEIQNYGGGSLWQQMQGHIGKQLTGKSIPDSVLNDMAAMQKIQAEGSKAKYENSLKTINQNFGSAFKPVEMDDMKSGQATMPSGATHQVLNRADGKMHWTDAQGSKDLGVVQ